MTNEEKIIEKFLSEYPAFKEEKKNLYINLYGDILQKDTKKIVAESDLPHSLEQLAVSQMPKKWALK